MNTIRDIAKLLTGKKKNSNDIHQINTDGILTSNTQIISNSFNYYFLSIIENRIPIAKNNNPIDYLYQAFKELFPTIKYQYTSTTEIEKKIIESLKAKDSQGEDEISVKILEVSSPFISPPLNYICNKLLSGIFPCRLKYAEVVPLFKKSNKKDMSNYRPVSLLTAFSKVFEKVIYVRLYQHLISHSVLVNEQFGRKAKLSTAKAIFSLINELLRGIKFYESGRWHFLGPGKSF
jgi:hypothetical protein